MSFLSSHELTLPFLYSTAAHTELLSHLLIQSPNDRLKYVSSLLLFDDDFSATL